MTPRHFYDTSPDKVLSLVQSSIAGVWRNSSESDPCLKKNLCYITYDFLFCCCRTSAPAFRLHCFSSLESPSSKKTRCALIVRLIAGKWQRQNICSFSLLCLMYLSSRRHFFLFAKDLTVMLWSERWSSGLKWAISCRLAGEIFDWGSWCPNY